MVKLYINAINYFRINYFNSPLLGRHEAERLIEKFPEITHIEMEDMRTGETLAEFTKES